MTLLSEYLNANKSMAYSFATSNTPHNKDGRTVISKNDEWNDETEWDELFQSLSEENKQKKDKRL